MSRYFKLVFNLLKLAKFFTVESWSYVEGQRAYATLHFIPRLFVFLSLCKKDLMFDYKRSAGYGI